MKNKLIVAKVLNQHTMAYDIIGGVFESKKLLNKWIKDNHLNKEDVETEEVTLNEPNYEVYDEYQD